MNYHGLQNPPKKFGAFIRSVTISPNIDANPPNYYYKAARIKYCLTLKSTLANISTTMHAHKQSAVTCSVCPMAMQSTLLCS